MGCREQVEIDDAKETKQAIKAPENKGWPGPDFERVHMKDRAKHEKAK